MLGVPPDRPQHALLPAHLWLPPGLARQLLVADAEGHHVASPRPLPTLHRDDVPVVRPKPVLDTGADDQVGPVGHRDVLALTVDVDIAGGAARRDRQVAADAVGAEAEVAERFERAELDLRSGERL